MMPVLAATYAVMILAAVMVLAAPPPQRLTGYVE